MRQSLMEVPYFHGSFTLQLVQIAGTSKRVYNGSDFEYLNQVIDDVSGSLCIKQTCL